MQRLSLLYLLAFTKALVIFGKPATAQSNIVPDTTLNENRSIVVPLDSFGLPIDEIQGGLSRGSNLFHSFLELNVSENRSAYFINSSNQLENILSRVTGNSPSEISGTLGIASSPGIGSKPNLLFINPNGILFGPNASLDLPASFVVSTADAIQLGDSGLFSANNPKEHQLLDVNPSALLFDDDSFGLIANQAVVGLPANGLLANPLPSIPQSAQISRDSPSFSSSRGLQVPDGQRLAIVGGDVALEGTLSSVGGVIDIGSVSGSGKVNLNFSLNGFTTDYSEVEQLGDIRLSSATVNASGSRGGGIQLQAARIFTDENNGFSGIFADTQGDLGGRGVFVRATDELFLEDAGISAVVEPGATGNGGSIKIESPSVFIRGGATAGLLTRNFGEGTGGEINIETDYLILREGAGILSTTSGEGDAGNIIINASERVDAQGIFVVGDEDIPGGIQADIHGSGIGGTISIVTKDVLLSDGAIISARTDDGPGGSVDIDASESVTLSSNADIRTQTFGRGDAGDIRIRTQRVQTGEGSEIDASASFGSSGDAGDIEIIASGSIEANGVGGFINAVLIAEGSSGDILIRTPVLLLRNGGTVSSETFTSEGSSGSIKVFSNFIEIDGGNLDGFTTSRITTRGSSSRDQPLGDVDIQTERLVLRNGGSISVDSISGNAPAGNLRIQASESIDIVGRSERINDSSSQEPTSSRISGRTRESSGGSIAIITPELNVSDEAIVSTTSNGAGRAGDISIVGGIVTIDTSGRIEATSSSGDGGDLNLQLDELLVLRRGAVISTNAGAEAAGGDGGNINIVSPFLVAVPEEDSDITANAFTGEGGRIDIQATGIFGTDARPEQTPLSDITASSDIGINGTIDISALNTEFIEEGLTELPSALINSETVISSSCVARIQDSNATLVFTGDNRLPSLPTTFLTSSSYPTGTARGIPTNVAEASEDRNRIVEPQSVYRTSDGRFMMSQECDRQSF